MTTTVPRPLPAPDTDSRAYWTGGERGELLIQRCSQCAYLIHPPTGFCPRCESRAVAFAPMSGRGTVRSYTVVHKQWMPGLQVPYVVALIALAEQDDVLLPTNIVDCDPESVRIDMKVKVRFEQAEDLWIPLFVPEDGE